MIPIKTQEEIKMMREAGKILGRIIEKLKKIVRQNLTTKDIDEAAQELMSEERVTSAFKDYRGFPCHICTSINHEIVHGIPSDRVVLKEGDIISIDIGIIYKGYFSDAAFTLAIGKVDSLKKKLIEVAKNALYLGIKQAKVDNHLSDISYSIQSYVEGSGFSVVREFVGHGIGKEMHEEPPVPNFGQPHCGPLLKNGMVLAIEPMVNMGGWEAQITDNGWAAVTRDGLPSAHFEHTVAITDKGPEVLTI
jgi:methionyl aminopeptidase